MTQTIVAFLVFGALFGLGTYSRRHLFSEGSTRHSESGARDALDGRVMWVLICSFLWPILILTAIYSARRLSRARAPGRALGDGRR